jgi:hypothetical protein
VLVSEQCFLNELRLNQNRKAVGVSS